ncbi:vitamin B12-binding protein [Lactobacillus ruminis]|nr:vitamin B12-binding protein [Ligilactobacillus ruminis]MSB53909.1 vitamin B12-binding protein [Ligilactobacillus ruminis]MSB55876.1 vitamin B12-binding protein [Ligilactobacillus ruminis]MSB80921.1 vitamin B12-binding protein [Ligilactobacillus ruminis]MSB91376.1 vitamin B12-binding protein [Ligilactobacillus ruminis]
MRKRRDYGQISKIEDLPVIRSRGLRADFKNRLFARNRRLGFTGRFQKSSFCP